MLIPNTILRERYRIIQPLGQGGMGAVYQAMDANLNCLVAVKETFAATEDTRRAFRREAELLANMDHPALPRVMDHFSEGEGQFLVMQFIAGHDLAELMRLREHPFPVDKVLEWADVLLDALAEMHANSPPIVHRDIKPANLKLTPKGKIILLDFGLAKGAAGQMTKLGSQKYSQSVLGYTPHYAPLEQMRGAGTDPRSDLYSLAAALWTLLTNRIPPDAIERTSEKEEGNADPLRPVHELNADVPASISVVLHRAMSLGRFQRPESATEIRRLLREAAEESRRAAEEEKRHADERRREEERRRQEAETIRIEREAARLAAEAQARREREEERRRAEDERRHAAREVKPREVKTLKGDGKPIPVPPFPNRAGRTDDLEATINQRSETARRRVPVWVYGAIGLVIAAIVLVPLAIYSLRTTVTTTDGLPTNTPPINNSSRPPAVKPANISPGVSATGNISPTPTRTPQSNFAARPASNSIVNNDRPANSGSRNTSAAMTETRAREDNNARRREAERRRREQTLRDLDQ